MPKRRGFVGPRRYVGFGLFVFVFGLVVIVIVIVIIIVGRILEFDAIQPLRVQQALAFRQTWSDKHASQSNMLKQKPKRHRE